MSADVAVDSRLAAAGSGVFDERAGSEWTAAEVELVSLADGVRALGPFVDGLELSWRPLGSELSRSPLRDELDLTLLELRGRGRGERPAVPPFITNGRSERVTLGRRGFRNAPFGLRCASWEAGVQFSGAPGPRAFVQLRAAYLAEVGPYRAYADVRRWVDEYFLPLVNGRSAAPTWRVSRLDLTVDLLGVDFEPDDIRLFTTRARKGADVGASSTREYAHRVLTGFTFGRRGRLFHRLYLKSTQAKSSDPALARLRTAGWDPTDGGPVWRSEYEIRSTTLREWADKLGLASLEPDDVFAALPVLWRHLVTKWLVLRDGQAQRSRIERTPVARWWVALADLAPAAVPSSPDVRPRCRLNIDQREAQLCGFVVSAAAVRGATTIEEALVVVEQVLRRRFPGGEFEERVRRRREELGLDDSSDAAAGGAAGRDEGPLPSAASLRVSWVDRRDASRFDLGDWLGRRLRPDAPLSRVDRRSRSPPLTGRRRLLGAS